MREEGEAVRTKNTSDPWKERALVASRSSDPSDERIIGEDTH